MVDRPFGEAVADPYRWLEGDLASGGPVAAWAQRQDALTRGYLATLPLRVWFAARIRALTDYERFGLPEKAGSRYFYTRNSGLQNQAQLWVRDSRTAPPRLLLDPNAWAADGSQAIDAWRPSQHGRFVAYSIETGGSDRRDLRVVDVASGRPLSDAIPDARFTRLAWVGDEGFLYSRYPARIEGAAGAGQEIRFHRLGTAPMGDVLVYATPDHPAYTHVAEVTADGRYAVIVSSAAGDGQNEVRIADLHALAKRGWELSTLAAGYRDTWRLVDGQGARLWFVTTADAPRGRLASVTLGKTAIWRTVVPEQSLTLEHGRVVGDRVILSYLEGAGSRAVVFDLAGRPSRALALAEIGTAAGFMGRPGDPETFYTYTSFNRPGGVYRFDLRSGKSEPFAVPRLGFDPHDFAIEQRTFVSRDGTKVPLFVVRRRDIAAAGRPVPTLLYGYGGFDISLTPGFSPARLAWIEAGGAFAMAGLRGGGEFGPAWHDAGRRANKQNVFDDFIAAGEYLIAQGIAANGGLAIQGGSNGGLLVGAVLNQRPDLFAAANPQVGVMDMLRFDRFTAGRLWTGDYGSPAIEADWRVLRAYSPYHNIRPGSAYPAVLVTTSDTDDRVVPAHSFKYVAALQAADPGAKPHLLRIEPGAGHGAGKPTDKAIAENADIMAFLAQWTGLRPI